MVSYVADGTCTLMASVAEGTSHLAATGSEQSFTVSAAASSGECTYAINPKNSQRNVLVAWENADPGVTLIQVRDGRTVKKQLDPTASGSLEHDREESEPIHELRGATRNLSYGSPD